MDNTIIKEIIFETFTKQLVENKCEDLQIDSVIIVDDFKKIEISIVSFQSIKKSTLNFGERVLFRNVIRTKIIKLLKLPDYDKLEHFILQINPNNKTLEIIVLFKVADKLYKKSLNF